MAKQQSIALRIRKTFPNEKIIEDFYVKKIRLLDLLLSTRKKIGNRSS